MKLFFRNLESRLGRKQFLRIIGVLAIGAAFGLLILVSGNKSLESREESKEHAEHHDEAKGAEEKKDGDKDAAHEATEIALSEAQIKVVGISIQKSEPAKIQTFQQLPGEIRFNQDRTAHIVPRLSGVVERVPANLGQLVKKGDILAVIASTDLSERRSELLTAQRRRAMAQIIYDREKKLWQEKISAEQDYLQAQQALRETEIAVANAQAKLVALGAGIDGHGPLNRYEIRAPFDGMVVEKQIALGEAVKEDANIFTLSDLTTVWAEIIVSARDLNTVRVGERVRVKAASFDSEAEGTISYVGSLLGQETRTATARVTLANPKTAWRPGMFVNVEVAVGQSDATVTVLNDAIQTLNEKPTVFVRTDDGFKAQAVTLGRTDGKRTEIQRGLEPGTPYAATNSYILKAELGKSSTDDDD